MTLRGSTALCGVVGSPIAHSLSPAIFNAAFAAAALDWAMAAFDVSEGDAGAALRGAQALGFRGLSVTMPLKAAMAGLVDTLSPAAAALGAVNSVAIGPEGTAGDSTDGSGLLDALASDPGWEPAGRRCLVLGGGGAARAVVYALAGAGAAEVVVVNRHPGRAAAAAALAGPVGRVGTAANAVDADAVVNATSVGMTGTPGAGDTPLDPTVLRSGQLVVDLVYHPLETPLLAAAAGVGALAVSGVGMLVHQAARQFRWWTGIEPPIDAMRSAATASLRNP